MHFGERMNKSAVLKGTNNQ